VLHGEAGVGKTALLDAAAQEAEEVGMRVLHSRADEGTTELPWAGLRALVAPLGDLVEQLPEVQADVLRAALGTSGETSATPDRFTVPVALLGLLGAAAEERPLLLVADDVQWIDAGSRDALVFMARRLANEGVGLLLGARDGEGFDVEATRLPALRIEGLGRDDARALLGADVAPAVADVLGEAVGGNPLALTEVAAALSARQRRGDEPLPQPLPAGARIAELYARRIAELPPSTRTAVGVAALMRLDRTDLLSAALAELDLTSDELFAAERAGVLELERGAVAFRHPLVRAAAAAALSGEDRRAARRALAAVAPDERLRAWHLAGAATGPDAEVAAALDAAARDARGRGAPAEALQAWERAAALSPRPADARRRWLEAARDALAAVTCRGCSPRSRGSRTIPTVPTARSSARGGGSPASRGCAAASSPRGSPSSRPRPTGSRAATPPPPRRRSCSPPADGWGSATCPRWSTWRGASRARRRGAPRRRAGRRGRGGGARPAGLHRGGDGARRSRRARVGPRRRRPHAREHGRLHADLDRALRRRARGARGSRAAGARGGCDLAAGLPARRASGPRAPARTVVGGDRRRRRGEPPGP
jgi:hypothetical protein